MKPKQLAILIIFLSTIPSCDKSGFPSQDFSISKINYEDCKSHTKAIPDEWLELTTTDDYYLSIIHMNSLFNCSPGRIIVEANQDDGTITINEYSTENLANCICPYDLSFSIGPLQYGNYTLSLKKSNLEILNVKIDFNRSLDLWIGI